MTDTAKAAKILTDLAMKGHPYAQVGVKFISVMGVLPSHMHTHSHTHSLHWVECTTAAVEWNKTSPKRSLCTK